MIDDPASKGAAPSSDAGKPASSPVTSSPPGTRTGCAAMLAGSGVIRGIASRTRALALEVLEPLLDDKAPSSSFCSAVNPAGRRPEILASTERRLAAYAR